MLVPLYPGDRALALVRSLKFEMMLKGQWVFSLQWSSPVPPDKFLVFKNHMWHLSLQSFLTTLSTLVDPFSSFPSGSSDLPISSPCAYLSEEDVVTLCGNCISVSIHTAQPLEGEARPSSPCPQCLPAIWHVSINKD